jgi:hypothetical protein
MTLHEHGAFTTNFLMYKLHVVARLREECPVQSFAPPRQLGGVPFLKVTK